ncbi:MAG: RNA 2',3'-cyclic phosphodiesterase [Leptospiraceae bacterium]|nr:RNA 2',3'-cyclic phosphodiesterase [Leptospiraceae bacterium]
MARIFIGIDLPESIKTSLERLQGGLPRTRFSQMDGLHLTLAFLGDLSTSQLDNLLRCCAAGNPAIEPFNLRIQGVGLFGRQRSRSILWAGLATSPGLLQLHQYILRLVSSANLKSDRNALKAHITLARTNLKPDHDRLLIWLQTQADLSLPPFLVDEYQIFESVLHPEGARYQIRAGFPLD